MNMKGVSVIVCCYNSSRRLQKTLQHLSVQLLQNIPWEILIVDNGSTDKTADVAIDIWDDCGKNCSAAFKMIKEPVPGLSNARQAGIAKAQYEYIVFCDDDNWLDARYIQTVYDILISDTSIGVLGGRCEAVSDCPLPSWFKENEQFYAVGPQAERTGDVQRRNFVYGAGMAFRKAEYLSFKEAGFQHLLSDRTGENLISGGDVEICYMYRLAGYKIWYDERLFFLHYMPKGRLEKDYLEKLILGAKAGVQLLQVYDPYLKGQKPPTLFRPFYFLYYLFRLLLAKIKSRSNAGYFLTYVEAFNPLPVCFSKNSADVKKALNRLIKKN
jgi:glycosyltransferase involved in cell wall biosynthesis